MADLAFGKAVKGENSRVLKWGHFEARIVAGDDVCGKCQHVQRDWTTDSILVASLCKLFGGNLTPHGRNYKRLAKCQKAEVK